jgi:hypothetical protein
MTDEWDRLIDHLTKDGHEWISTDEGKKLADRQGLLPQLRAAIFGGMENTGGASSFASKPPLDAAAIDLLEEITDQASQVLAAVSHMPTPYGHAEHYVSLWAAQATESQRFTVHVRIPIPNFVYDRAKPDRPSVTTATEQYTALELLRRWSERCEDFFNPPSTREIPAPCPACGSRYVHRVKDGETIRSASLNILRSRDKGTPTEARCAVCGASWAPAQFGFLATLVGAKDSELIIDKPKPEKPVIQSEACWHHTHSKCESVRCQCDCHLGIDTPAMIRITTV